MIQNFFPFATCGDRKYGSDRTVIGFDYPQELPPSFFSPYRLLIDEDNGDLSVETDYFNYSVISFDEINNSADCTSCILQLFSYMRDRHTSFAEFFGFREVELEDLTLKGELFQYYLLLLERFLHLLAAEQAESGEEPKSIMVFSEDDHEAFFNTKQQARLFLKMLELSWLEYPISEISAKLKQVSNLFIQVFPDAFFLATLSNFDESCIDSLNLSDKIFEGMPSANLYSFRKSRLFQSFPVFRDFPWVLCHDFQRFSVNFVLLLKRYCGEYTSEEFHTAILNVSVFVVYSLPNLATMEALNYIFTELERHSEITGILEEISSKQKKILGSIASQTHDFLILRKRLEEFLTFFNSRK